MPSCFRVIVPLLLVTLLRLSGDPRPTGRYQTVVIEPVRTSIYVGTVSLSTSPMQRSGDLYTGNYNAKVFPFFFESEKGRLAITFTDEDLAKLEIGQAVFFKGHAENSDHETRRIEGRALPADTHHGKIKVRVFVTQKIELIFNAEYHFGDG